MIIKVIHIVTIIKTPDNIIIIGSSGHSPSNTYNYQNQNSKKDSIQNTSNSHKQQGINYIHNNFHNNYSNNYNKEPSKNTVNRNYSNYSNSNKVNFNNHKSSSTVNINNNLSNKNYSKNSIDNNYVNNNFSNNPLNNNQINTTDNNEESLLLNDVYGKASYSNSGEKTSNDSSNFFTNNSNNTSNTPDFSALLGSFLQNNSNSNNNNSENSNDFNMPDFETMLKFKKIFERLNSKSSGNDPMINLLYAIKPFIQESKKSIIDQITKFMTISTVLQDFNGFL